MKRNRLLLPLGALLAVFALGAVVMMVRASADDMLYEAARLLTNIEDGHAVVAVDVQAPEQAMQGTVEMWAKQDAGPDGEPAFRMEVLQSSEPEMQGVIAVGDGTQVWLWNPAKNTVYVGTAEEMKAKMAEHEGDYDAADFDRPDFDPEAMPETPEDAVDKLLEYFTAERAGGSDIAGTAVEQLRLIPIPEQMPEEMRANGGLLNLWLRATDSAPMAAEYTGGAVGYAKATATVLELNQGLSADLFTFEIPEGAEVVNLADIEPPADITADEAAQLADFAVLQPAELPAAARLEGISEMRGAIVQRYRLPDGERFTIAQGAAEAGGRQSDEGTAVSVRGVDGLLFEDEDGARALLSWTEGGVSFWVGGDVSAAEALSIAESLR